MRRFTVWLVVLLLVPVVFAADKYTPYLHQPAIQSHPDVKLFGQYQTLLYAGAATYNYGLDVPAGTNGLSPSLSLLYNSQSTEQSSCGLGWSLPQNKIVRDMNATPDSTSDDSYVLFFNGWQYQLIYDVDQQIWRTEVDYHFRIRNLTDGVNPYWDVTTTDGTRFEFGKSTRVSGRGYVVGWYQDDVIDIYNNTVYYEYTTVNNTVYPAAIRYNSDKLRNVLFSYVPVQRPITYEDGVAKTITQQLQDISVYANNVLVRRYHADYDGTGVLLRAVTRFGADNASVLHTINFSYYGQNTTYALNPSYAAPVLFITNAKIDNGVRLVDVNADGFSDVVQGVNGSRNIWLNNRTGWVLSNWSLPVDVVVNGSDAGVRFADVNNDGLVDLLLGRNGTRAVYLNNGSGWTLSNWSLPVDFVNSSGVDQSVQLIDINNDGRVDLVQANAGVSDAVYLNTGAGWVLSSWSLPVKFYSGSRDLGARFVDLNGDGLPDVILGNGSRDSWYNNGTGWLETSAYASPVDFVNSSGDDMGVRLFDVNQDGLADLVQSFVNGATSYNATWLNNGTGWVQNTSYVVPLSFVFNGSSVDRRLADVNGDGIVDLLVSSNQTQTYVHAASLPSVIFSIRNEYGGTTNISYVYSTKYNNTDANNVSTLGFPLLVVSSITTNNGMNGTALIVASTNYSYASGLYNYSKREFRGFAASIEQRPTKLLTHSFYQDAPRRAKEYSTSIYSLNGSLYLTTTTDYNYTYANSIYNLTITSRTKYEYDGSATPRVTNTSYNYDWFGNLWSATEYGDASVFGDERYTNNTFGYNKDLWILNRMSTSRTYDASLNKVRETRYYYDNLGLTGVGAYGALTRKEQWNNNGNDTAMSYEYDSFGNLLRSTDGAGGQTMYQYDPSHTFVVTTINPLGHTMYAGYDLGTGNLLWSKKNDIVTSYLYDTHGRIVSEVQPYDTIDMPTKKYIYNFSGVAPSKISISLRTTANNTMDSSYYYDGFANLAQITSLTDAGMIVKNVYYDGENRVVAEDNPYSANTNTTYTQPAIGTPQTNYTYDPLDRVVLVLNPDGTNKTTTFNKGVITDYDENGHRHLYETDVYGRITAVHEYNTDPRTGSDEYITKYAYDANDNLVGITDAVGNNFIFSYDSLSRKVGMSDPDMGNWSYAYDTRNNLVTQTDARNRTILLTYDLLSRVLQKNSSMSNVSFSYDGQYLGTLTNMTMGTVTMQYSYDERLRLSSLSQLLETSPLTSTYVYDSQDRLLSNQEFGKLDYYYNKQGAVYKIPGFIPNASYDAFGGLANVTYNNGLIATYMYDTRNHRLINITIPNVLVLNYSYDNVGNIKAINDLVTGKLTNLTYDSLDRLIYANIGADRYTYSYNPTGNMMNIVKNNASKKFIYTGLAHAPSTIIDGGAGADVQHVNIINSSSKNKTIEFFVANDQNSTITGVNVSIRFGDGNLFTTNNVSINNSILYLVQNNYSFGGDYVVNVTSLASGMYDSEFKKTKFGLRANSLSVLGKNVSKVTYEFVVGKDVNEILSNVSWNCSLFNNTPTINLTSSWYDYLQLNYSSPGTYQFVCTAFGSDGTEAKIITVDIPGVSIENVDTLYVNGPRRILSSTAKNYYYPLTANVSLSGENIANVTKLVNLSTNEQLFIFEEVNNTPGNAKGVTTSISSGNDSSNQTTLYDVKTVSMTTYNRIDLSNTTKFYTYEVKNLWSNGTLLWNLSDPSLSNSSILDNNKSLLILVANNYSSGDKTPTLLASTAGYGLTTKDSFSSRPVAISRLQTLIDGLSPVNELLITNYVATPQNVSWQFNNGQNNFTNLSSINSSIFIFIRSNYSMSQIYSTRANISWSAGNDTKTGVVIA